MPEAGEQLALIPPVGIEKLKEAATNHVSLLRMQGLLAHAEGRRAEAIAVLEEALGIARKVFGERSHWTKSIADDLSSARGT